MPTFVRAHFLPFCVLVTSSVLLAQPADAQADQLGRLEGTVTDSVHARPLAGVRVVAVGAEGRAGSRGTASTDSSGRYRIESLQPGRYLVGLESPLLDSLEITVAPREVSELISAATWSVFAFSVVTALFDVFSV